MYVTASLTNVRAARTGIVESAASLAKPKRFTGQMPPCRKARGFLFALPQHTRTSRVSCLRSLDICACVLCVPVLRGHVRVRCWHHAATRAVTSPDPGLASRLRPLSRRWRDSEGRTSGVGAERRCERLDALTFASVYSRVSRAQDTTQSAPALRGRWVLRRCAAC
jgi:hypothetical protein